MLGMCTNTANLEGGVDKEQAGEPYGTTKVGWGEWPYLNDSRCQYTLKSQLILVNFYFVLPQFHIKRARFSWVFITQVQFCTQIVVLYFFRDFSEANVFSLSQKFGPHAQHQTVHSFPVHQQLIDLNNWWKLQSLTKKYHFFKYSSNNQATV